jgi:response regulator RpfG family c-di-GMP phosphodiesterase
MALPRRRRSSGTGLGSRSIDAQSIVRGLGEYWFDDCYALPGKRFMRITAMEGSQSAQWTHPMDPLDENLPDQTFETPRESQKLLIVDDERCIRDILVRYLTQRGHVCMEAADGNQAVGLLRYKVFDAVITDLYMPGVHGLDLIRTIRNQDADVAIVVISANQNSEDAVRALRLGADDYIFKPIDLAEVSICLDRALAKRNLKLQIHDYQAALENTVAERTSQVHHMLLHVVECLVHTLEAKDPYTDGHSQRVAWLSAQLGEAAGLENHELEILQLGSMFHDLGKIGIQESILNKPGSLTVSEYELVKRHPDLGVRILQPLQELQTILPIVRHHHEHFDGKGYPDGIAGENIPRSARIVALADNFDALTSARSYRAALGWEEASAIIRAGIGSLFDPSLAEIFLPLVENKRVQEMLHSPEWIMNDGTIPDLGTLLSRHDATKH